MPSGESRNTTHRSLAWAPRAALSSPRASGPKLLSVPDLGSRLLGDSTTRVPPTARWMTDRVFWAVWPT